MKKKKLLFIATAIMIIIALVLPCFAADGQSFILYIYDNDVGMQYSEPIEINSINDYLYTYINYDTTNRQLTCYASDTYDAAPYSTGCFMIYTIQLPQYYYAEVSIIRGVSELYYDIGYGNNTTRYIYDNRYVTQYDYTYFQIALDTNYSYSDGVTEGYADGYNDGFQDGESYVNNNPNQYGLYTQVQYDTYGNQRYLAGQQAVQLNPNGYGLYTTQQYNAYGQSEYNRGKTDGLAEGGEYSQAQYEQYGEYMYDIGYTNGQLQGHTDSETLVGIGNVILTGIYNVFMWITGNNTIFGITVISIIGSALIILVVFAIFKIVRG